MTDQAVTLEEGESAFYNWRESPMPQTIQDRAPNFRDDEGQLYLVRCYACEQRENYVLMVGSGQCAWCGWREEAETGVLEDD